MISIRPRLIAILIAGVVAADFVLPALALQWNVVAFFWLVAWAAQTGLHSVWVATGRTAWPLRFLTLIPAWGCIYLPLLYWDRHAFDELMVVYPVQAALTIGGLMAMGVVGFRITGLAERQMLSELGRSQIQFSIRDLMILTTVCGIGVVAAVRLHDMQLDSGGKSAAFGVCGAVTTLLSVWSALGARQIVLPVAVTLGISIAIGLGFAIKVWGPGFTPFAFLFAVIAVLGIVPLLFVRRAGVRFERVNKAS